MKVGIFGGAFDPIHDGHILTAGLVLTKTDLDEVWFMPCYHSMFAKKMAAPQHRLKMVEIALENCKHMEAFDFEIKHRLTSDSYTIMNLIKKNYPNVDFYFIIGQDNANKMQMWGHNTEIINENKFVVMPRNGYPVMGDGWYEKSPHIYLEGLAIEEPMSSTMIRKQLKHAGMSVPRIMNVNVYKYIQEYGLYSNKFY